MFTLPPQKIALILLLLLAVAAVYDVRYRRIPNWLTVGGVLIGFALNWIIGPPEAGILFSLEGFAIGFGVYMMLYVLRAMGAGDAKLMAAVGAMLGPGRWIGVFLVSAIVGGILGFLLVLFKGRAKATLWNVGYILSEMRRGRPAYLGKEELDVRSPKAVGMPHGAVIAIGTLFHFAISMMLAR